ncbi:radical SAM protein [Nocardia niigatensis]
MTNVDLPLPALRSRNDGYGHARMPRGANVPEPERIDRVAYGRFRNVYLYITEACQLRCEHCYMGERLDRALKMPLPKIVDTLTTWRRLGGSKLTILGGEPTLHPHYCEAIRLSRKLGYEHVITTTNAQKPALRRLGRIEVARSSASESVKSSIGNSSKRHQLGGGNRDTMIIVDGGGSTEKSFGQSLISKLSTMNVELEYLRSLKMSLSRLCDTLWMANGSQSIGRTTAASGTGKRQIRRGQSRIGVPGITIESAQFVSAMVDIIHVYPKYFGYQVDYSFLHTFLLSPRRVLMLLHVSVVS